MKTVFHMFFLCFLIVLLVVLTACGGGTTQTSTQSGSQMTSTLPAGSTPSAPPANQTTSAPSTLSTPTVSLTISTPSAPQKAGTVWAWGQNDFGVLGNGKDDDTHTIYRLDLGKGVSVMNGVVKVDTFFWNYSMALKSDGTVWNWGQNDTGMLGTGSLSDPLVDNSVRTPVQVEALNNIKDISAGYDYSLALKSDGSVWVWGEGGSILGTGDEQSRTTPVHINGLTGVTAISAGYDHSIALRSDGTVWAWGENNVGQLGDGTETARSVPTKVGNLSGVVAIESGEEFSLALKSDGTVWAWGSNSYGKLGTGNTDLSVSDVPVKVSGLTNIKSISAAGHFSLALKNDGTVWAWGSNDRGELGMGNDKLEDQWSPVKVQGITGVQFIYAGEMNGFAIKSDGTLWCWGSNDFNCFGLGDRGYSDVPIQEKGISGVMSVAASRYHALAIAGS